MPPAMRCVEGATLALLFVFDMAGHAEWGVERGWWGGLDAARASAG
jgi:hypothetical protein